jgi:uncharacterized membrane protein
VAASAWHSLAWLGLAQLGTAWLGLAWLVVVANVQTIGGSNVAEFICLVTIHTRTHALTAFSV